MNKHRLALLGAACCLLVLQRAAAQAPDKCWYFSYEVLEKTPEGILRNAAPARRQGPFTQAECEKNLAVTLRSVTSIVTRPGQSQQDIRITRPCSCDGPQLPVSLPVSLPYEGSDAQHHTPAPSPAAAPAPLTMDPETRKKVFMMEASSAALNAISSYIDNSIAQISGTPIGKPVGYTTAPDPSMLENWKFANPKAGETPNTPASKPPPHPLALPSGEREGQFSPGQLFPLEWTQADRLHWAADSTKWRGIRFDSTAGNSFIRAAFYATKHRFPELFQNPQQRRDYYALVAYLLEKRRSAGSRFFAAASLAGNCPQQDAPEADSLGAAFSDSLNSSLFAANMAAAAWLLQPEIAGKPAAGDFASEALLFDIQLAFAEQRRLQDCLPGLLQKGLPPQQVQALINPWRAQHCPQTILDSAFQWAASAIGELRVDPGNLLHRAAFVSAAVCLLHRQSRDDFLERWQHALAAHFQSELK